ncbi:Ribosomal RNA small subunit methyltransferase D [Pirellulimonas nuda]|uniref:Ribosomal RNA small subunit methyltransferase D n=1 Tax=Pirellulimonas nuda TaxID=2528009 RepID=A0A518D5E6_9BACT|nr:RsmD family RNA methyltransferase [Pirellulimonas nuda]QDU86679.1 Ribosomal RNA small subunit methyltransferase D [Pirellulimonas nuda]
MPRRKPAAKPKTLPPEGPATDLRIVGGSMRGRKLAPALCEDDGDPVTRPMKHRVREAIFNLVGMRAKGTHALDLFAGTGALGLESISRGADWATFIERHIPTAAIVKQNMASLGVVDRCDLLTTSAFLWAKRDLPKGAAAWSAGPADAPWLAFVSPPYRFYQEREAEMRALVAALQAHSPAGSMVVVESDQQFDPGTLETPGDDPWDVRVYPPAVVGVWTKASR